MIDPAPIYQQLADKNGKPTIPWTLFFNDVRNGDAGTAWTPTFVNLTTVGTPAFDARYYSLSTYLVVFRVTITPATSTSATAGSTYIDNFPKAFTADGIVFAVTGGVGDGPGHIIASSNRIYTPGWSVITAPLTLIGIGEAA